MFLVTSSNSFEATYDDFVLMVMQQCINFIFIKLHSISYLSLKTFLGETFGYKHTFNRFD